MKTFCRWPASTAKLLVAAAIASLPVAMPVPAQAGFFNLASAECTAPAPEIALTQSKPGYVVDDSYDSARITNIAADNRASLTLGMKASGLAVASYSSNGQFRSNVWEMDDGMWCVSLTHADFSLGFDRPVQVFVGSEYAEGSCARRAILEHELQHVALYEKSLDDMMGPAKQKIETEVMRFGASAMASTPAEANKILTEAMDRIMGSVVSKIGSYAEAKNSKLDTPVEYKRVEAQCQDWNITQ
jgi:hypothetical protein